MTDVTGRKESNLTTPVKLLSMKYFFAICLVVSGLLTRECADEGRVRVCVWMCVDEGRVRVCVYIYMVCACMCACDGDGRRDGYEPEECVGMHTRN